MSQDESRHRLGRRLLALRIAAGGAAASLATALPARAQGGSDRDPNDPPGGGRGRAGVTDRDPNDAPNRSPRSSGTDRDPNDAPNRGRAGVVDNDPSDRTGNGGGCASTRRGCTDNDPGDPPGGGRRR